MPYGKGTYGSKRGRPASKSSGMTSKQKTLPTALHHIRNNGTGNVGIGKRSSHFEVIPLCYEHHQGNTGIHLDKKNFENKYGTEKQILDIVRDRVIEQDELSSINFL
jgi:hypothetical protein